MRNRKWLRVSTGRNKIKQQNKKKDQENSEKLASEFSGFHLRGDVGVDPTDSAAVYCCIIFMKHGMFAQLLAMVIREGETTKTSYHVHRKKRIGSKLKVG